MFNKAFTTLFSLFNRKTLKNRKTSFHSDGGQCLTFRERDCELQQMQKLFMSETGRHRVFGQLRIFKAAN